MGIKKENEKEVDILSSSIKSNNAKDVKKSEKALVKAEKQRAKANAKRAKYDSLIKDLKTQIANETDETKKSNLIAKRDALIKQRDSVSTGTSKSTKKVIRNVIIIVLVVSLLVVHFATGNVRNGLLAQFSIPQKTVTAASVVDKDGVKHPIKVSTYNFYFANMYNNLKQTQMQLQEYSKKNNIDLGNAGIDVDFNEKFSKQTFKKDDGTEITWAQHIQEDTLEQIKNTYLYYYEALAANDGVEPELTQEQQKQIDDNIAQYTEAAHKQGFETSAFIRILMGRGVNENVMRRELKVSLIADSYKQEFMKNIADEEITSDQIEAYKNEHFDELKSVDIRIFECTNEDNAKEFASQLKKDGSNFNQLAAKFTDDEFTKTVLIEDSNWTYNINATKDMLKQFKYAIATPVEHTHAEGEQHNDNEPGLYPGLDWLFSSDRKAGDSYQYSTTVVYVVRPAGISDVKAVDVRHILINPVITEDSNYDQTKATQEQWDSAYAKAQEIVDKFNAGEKTAEAFGELAKVESKDQGSASKGGLYEDVQPGQMVASFNGWCFDSSRKSGDVGIVKSQYGYHVMYFDGVADDAAWVVTAKNALAQTDSQDKFSVKEEEYSIKVNAFGELFLQRDVDMNA